MIKALPQEAHKRGHLLFRKLRRNRTLLLMCLPAILFFFVFAYVPMPGIYIAFVHYNYAKGIFRSPFAGMENFRFLFASGELLRLTRNTLLYNLGFMLLGNLTQVMTAVLLHEVGHKRFRRISQMILFLPYFVSPVIVGLFAYNMLSFDHGVVNHILKILDMTPVNVYGTASIWPVIIMLFYIWQNTGYGSIIYYAAITALDQELYEAATMDGAGRPAMIWNITLPGIRPTVIMMMLYALGGIIRGNFGLIYNLVGSGNTTLFGSTDVIETFVFRSMMNSFNISMGSAVGLYQSVFGCLMVLVVNGVVRHLEREDALF